MNFVYICFYWRTIQSLSNYSILSPCFFKTYSKQTWISDIKYDRSTKSNLSFEEGADILNLLLFIYFFNVFYVYYIFRFDKATLFPPLLKSILSVSFNIKTCGLEVLLFSEFITIVSILYLYWFNYVVIYVYSNSFIVVHISSPVFGLYLDLDIILAESLFNLITSLLSYKDF